MLEIYHTYYVFFSGIHVPSKDDVQAEKPKRPQYGRKKKPNKNNQQNQEKQEEIKSEEPPKSPESVVETPKPAG